MQPISWFVWLKKEAGNLFLTNPKTDAPIMRRIVSNEKGGITSKTTLLTTYMPPQIEAAVRPDINPANV